MKSAVIALVLLATFCHGQDLADPHIVNGDEVVPHSYPHQVALEMEERGEGNFCGGSLISDRWVVTAAHCAEEKSRLIVVAGAHDIDRVEESQQRVKVEQIIIHPEWNIQKIRNDIALLKLNESVNVDGRTVKPIRLPKLSDKDKSFWFWEATMTGWGKTSSHTGGSATLRFATERVISNAVCKASFLFFLVDENNICTSGIRSRKTCHGDSGGPLVIQEEDGERTLVGITSFGFPNCDWKWPSVFTRVPSYVEWINKTTGIPLRA